MKKRLAAFLLSIVLVVAVVPTPSALAAGLDVNTPTQEEIAQYYQTHDMGQLVSDTFAVNPVTTAPYAAGVLSDTTLTHAINTVNYVRLIAGLDYDVTVNDSYNEYAAAAALVNQANGGLSHYPTQPEGMSSTLFKKGYTGAGSSNLSSGHSKMYVNIISGWMGDYSSQSNLECVGHRRWVLNPTMSATGFGTSGNYRAMYAFDTQNKSATQTTVAWPAQNTPVDLFASSYPWSYSQTYSVSTSTTTTVTLTRYSDGASWYFDTSNEAVTDGYIAISNAGYGSLKGCVIFRPTGVSYSAGDVFHVSIEGGVEVEYDVTFFDVTAVGMETTTTTTTTTTTPTTTPVTTTETTATATPSSTKLMVNGEAVSVDAYLIEDNNYIKLRDLATMVNGTEKNFEVTWNETMGAIEMLSGTSYTAVGGEMTTGTGASRSATLSTATVYCDGQVMELTAYTIDDNNYFKLRDIMACFDIAVGYDEATATATIDT